MNKVLKISMQDFIILLLFTSLLFYIYLTFQGSTQPEYPFSIEIEVNEGDTLWAIASMYREGMSTQSYLSVLRTHNDLEKDVIFPGQVILVPLMESKEVYSFEGNYLLSSKY